LTQGDTPFSLKESLGSAGFSPTPQLYIFEAEFGALDGLFVVRRDLWFENLLDWIAGAEDVVMISEDLVSVDILTHYHMLRLGDRSAPRFRDPYWT
jgi:hypothetical protein